MWRVLRAELAYFRPYLLAAWAIAFAVAVMVNMLTLIGTRDGQLKSLVVTGLPGIFFIIAAMIVGFIAQGQRSDERRARLLLTGPLTPRQLAGVMVLLPASLVGLGIVAGSLIIGAASLLTGQLDLVSVHMVSGVAAQMFAIVQMGPLAQESTAARRQQRSRAAAAGWICFVLAILALIALQVVQMKIAGILGQPAIAVTAMAASVVLYAGRTDFTR